LFNGVGLEGVTRQEFRAQSSAGKKPDFDLRTKSSANDVGLVGDIFAPQAKLLNLAIMP